MPKFVGLSPSVRWDELVAGFQQGLQAAEDIHPSGSDDTRGGVWGLLEPVVNRGEHAGAVALIVDLPGDAACGLAICFGVEQRPPTHHEAMWPIGFQHDLVAPQ